MKHIKSHKILWWTIPFVFIPILSGTISAFDIQLHDTYYVLATVHLAIALALILGFLGSIYWLIGNYKLNRTLSIIHTSVTSISVIGIALVAILQSLLREYNIEYLKTLNSIGAIFLLILITIQLIFLINIIIGLTKGKG